MFSEEVISLLTWSTVWIMPSYLKRNICADQFGGITAKVQQILTTFFLQASFHSNVYSNCWRIRIFAWRQEGWRKLKTSTSGHSRYKITFLISQFFYNWLHSFKEMYKMLKILNGCWQLVHFFGYFLRHTLLDNISRISLFYFCNSLFNGKKEQKLNW